MADGGEQRRKRGRPRGKAGAPGAATADGDTRELILRCSVDMFSQHGYEGVSVRDIAQMTDTALPSIYYYFGSKRGLYLQSCLSVFDTWGASHGEYLVRRGSPQQQLFDYIAGISDSLTQDRLFSTLLQREILERDVDGIRTLTQSIFGKHFRIVTDRCRELEATLEPALAAHTLYALVFGLAQLRGIAHELAVGQQIEQNEAMAAHTLTVVLPHVRWSRYRFRPIS